MRAKLAYLCCFVVLVAAGGWVLIQRHHTALKPLPPSPSIVVNKVMVCPCYTRLSMPSQQELLAKVDRVVSITDRLRRVYLSSRSNTLILKFQTFKVVVFSDLLRELAAEGKTARLREGEMVTVRGLLRDHPRYGLEIILGRPQDLVVGITA